MQYFCQGYHYNIDAVISSGFDLGGTIAGVFPIEAGSYNMVESCMKNKNDRTGMVNKGMGMMTDNIKCFKIKENCTRQPAARYLRSRLRQASLRHMKGSV